MSRRPPLQRQLRAALCLSTLWLCLGCGKLREVSACRTLARDINTAVDDVEALSKRKPPDELAIAKRYVALADTLAPRSLTEAPLAVAIRDYVVVLRATDAALRAHELAGKTPYGRVAEAKRDLDRLIKRDRAAVSRLEAECHN